MISPRHGFLTGRIQQTARVNLDRVTTHHGPFRLHPTRLSVDCPSLLSPLGVGLLENCFSQCKSMFFLQCLGPGEIHIKTRRSRIVSTHEPSTSRSGGAFGSSLIYMGRSRIVSHELSTSRSPPGGLLSQRKFLLYRASCSSHFHLDSRFVAVIAILILILVVVVCRCFARCVPQRHRLHMARKKNLVHVALGFHDYDNVIMLFCATKRQR